MSRNFLLVDPEERADVLRGLASPVRVRMLKALHQRGGLNVNDMAALLELPQSTVSSNLQILEELGEDGLSRPSKQTLPSMEELQGTAGKALLLIALHQMFHAGQAADVRRALQRKPVFM